MESTVEQSLGHLLYVQAILGMTFISSCVSGSAVPDLFNLSLLHCNEGQIMDSVSFFSWSFFNVALDKASVTGISFPGTYTRLYT